MKIRTLVTTLAVVLVPAAFSCSDPGSESRVQKGAFEQREQMGRERMGPSQRPMAAPLGPAEIADIVFVINLGEVAQARMAEQHAQNEQVREFARRMREDHGQGLQRLRRLMGGGGSMGQGQEMGETQGVGQREETGRMRMPRDPSAQLMARQDELITKDLESQQEGMFDLAYMTTQIGAHAKALGLLERVLIPALQQGGQNEQLGEPEEQQGGQGEQPGLQLGQQREQGGPQQGGDPLLRELSQMREDVSRHLEEAVQIHAQLRGAMQQEQMGGGGRQRGMQEPRGR